MVLSTAPHKVDPPALQARANADPEFRLAARHWHATLSFEYPTHALRVATQRLFALMRVLRANPEEVSHGTL